MRQLILTTCLTMLGFTSLAGTFTSHSDGEWNDGASVWTIVGDADGIPDYDDDVIITGGTVVDWGLSSSSNFCRSLTVDGTINGPGNSTFSIRITGDYTNNGIETGSGIYTFMAATSTISGAGTWSSQAIWNFLGFGGGIIESDVTVTKNFWTRIYNGADVTNRGNLTVGNVIAYAGSSVFTNEGTLTLTRDNFMTTGSFDCSFVGNTVDIEWNPGTTSQNVPNPSNGSYYNLIYSSTNFHQRASADITVVNDFTMENNSLPNMNGFDLFVGGDMSDGGATFFNWNTLNFNGTTQSFTRTAGGTENFDIPVIVEATSDLTINSDIRVTDLTIDGSLDVTASDNSITLLGDWTNNGTFIPNTGTVFLEGTGLQTISGSGTDFFAIDQDNSAGVTVASGNVNMFGRLRLNDGSFASNGFLNLRSDGVNQGMIGILCSSCAVTGTVHMEQVIAAGAADFRDLSYPFASGGTLAMWDDDMIISCPSCGDGCAYGNGCYVSIKTFDANTQTYQDITGMGQSFGNTTGYEAFLGDNLNTYSGGTIDVSGTVNGAAKIQFIVPVEWSLIGNPYASTITFDAVTTAAGIDNFFYVYDQTIGGYAFYEQGGSTTGAVDAAGDIAPMQGFWIFANTGTTSFNRRVEFLQTSKRNNLTPIVKSQALELAQRIPLILENKSNGSKSKTALNLCSIAYSDKDTLDVMNFRGPNHSIKPRIQPIMWFNVDNQEIRSNYVPFNGDLRREFNLSFNTPVAGRFTIESENLGSFSEYNCVILRDNLLNKEVNLRESGYTFESMGSANDQEDRFTLILSNEAMCDILLANNNENKEKEATLQVSQTNTNTLMIDYTSNNLDGGSDITSAFVNFKLFDLTGRIVYQTNLDANVNSTTIAIPELSSGTYVAVYGAVSTKVVIQ